MANYENLNVHFDLWKGEADVQPYIPDMIADFEARGIAHADQGALIVDVAEESDTKEIPPCIVRKSDGAALYATTDLATILERQMLYAPDELIYSPISARKCTLCRSSALRKKQTWYRNM